MIPFPSTPLPQELEPYRKEGEKLLLEGAVKALEFSRRTYQVLVFDAVLKESFWGFIHLNRSGEVAEYFCQCADELEEDRCAHLAAGILKIYNQKSSPLHSRYKKSFWRALGFVLFQRNEKVKIASSSPEGANFLKDFSAQKDQLEEESSLKFSDLSEKELKSVREGNLSEELAFEFSWYSDLSKKLFFLEEEKTPPDFFFKVNSKGFPLKLSVSSDLFSFDLMLTPKELEFLIPFLATVKAPLKLRGGFKDLIKEAYFDKEKGSLILTRSDFDIRQIKGVSIGGWIFVSGDGFYRIEHDPLLDQKEIKKDQMDVFLDRYPSKLQDQIKEGVWEKKGHLFFDKKGSLHITHYLFSPLDLSGKEAWTFGDWVYLPNQGFFKTLIPQDLPEEKVIKKPSVYEWVLTHQSYLSEIEGFKVHLKELESFIKWHIDSAGALYFESILKGDFHQEPQEYGALIYVKGEGFFSKASFKDAMHVQGGLKIPAVQVPSYIRQHEADLKLVSGFFVKTVPVQKGSIDISLKEGKIVINPTIELIEALRFRKSRLYEDYLWIEDEGFYRLPEKNFLPLEFREEKVIPERLAKTFIDKSLPKLTPFISKMDDALKSPKQIQLKFDKSLFFQSELGVIPFDAFLSAFKKGKRLFFSPLGRIDLQDVRFQRLGKLFKDNSSDKLSLMEVYKLKAFEEINLNVDDYKKVRPLDITGLKSSLRAYQEIGVRWLWSLYCNGLSGLLCDDMGLGKTHQAMALMAAVKNSTKEKKKFLIVCPTSVLYHWEEKLAAFLPAFKVHIYHGVDRSIKGYKEEGEVLLTSYGILRRDIQSLKDISFEVAIYDEIQTAKNHLSRLWVTLKEIDSPMTLGLTGTPIENSLRELKSLFDIVIPSLMPSEQEFSELFVKPIEKEESLKAKALLHRYIDPFLLRRKKEDVLLDLPEKTEEISHTAMLPKQKALYEKLYLTAKETLLPDLLDDMKIIPYIHIFALLSGLKKICNHPALYLKKIEDYKRYESGKWELFVELLHEAIGSEQKVVVFSHFLGMLDIIESFLAEEGIGYASLRGSTNNRKEMIHRFQTDPECRVFVASLQAGGLGIDLTEASVVIHYDRWWNAARENQATDRVHRIGQKRGVQVFKLVTVNTIEDRINELIEKKHRRMEEIVGRDGADAVKTLTRDELIQIFQSD